MNDIILVVQYLYMFLLPPNSWEIQKTKKKGLGIFTKEQIKAGTVIGDYLGTIIKTAEYDLERDKKGLFLMYFSDKASIYPDLTKPGIHLLNHSCMPNCWIHIHQGHTLFFALRKIDPGEELTISYLLSPDDDCRSCTHACMCESVHCTGSMHLSKDKYQKWQAFQDNEIKNMKRTKILYGRNLPELKKYPLRILLNPIYAEVMTSA